MSASEKNYKQAMDKGHSAAWEQNWERAASYYRHALDEKEDDPKALTSLALALFNLREYQQSLHYYLRASEVDFHNPVPLERAAILFSGLDRSEKASKFAVEAAERYLKEKNIEKAIENWSRAVAMNPENLRAHSRLAVVYQRLGRDAQAIREFLHLASLLQNMGKQEQAFEAVNQALKIEPNSQGARQTLTMLRAGKSLPKPARPQGGTGPLMQKEKKATPQLEAPEESIDSELDPIEETNREALSRLANLIFEQSADDEEEQSGQANLKAIMEGAGEAFSKSADKTTIMLHLGEAVDLQSRGKLEEAAEALKGAMSAGLDTPAAIYTLGMLRVKTDRIGSARRYLQQVISHSKYALGALLLLADLGYQKEKYKKAATRYLEALAIADSQIVSQDQADELRELYDPLIESLSRQNDDEANKKLSENIEELLVRPNWRAYLRDARQQLGEQEMGITPVAELLMGASSSDIIMAMSNVRKLAREGRMDAALEEIFFALKNAPTYLPLHVVLGDLLISRGNLDEATEKFSVVARAYSVRGEHHRAITVLRRVVNLNPMDLEARQRLIEHLVAHGKIDDAMEEYIALAETHYSLAELEKAKEMYSRALQQAKKSDHYQNWQLRLLHRIADIDMQSLNWREAVELFEQICSIKPGDREACRNLVSLYFNLKSPEKAIGVIDRFVAQANKSDGSDGVIEFLEDVLSEHPDQAIIHHRLAVQYQQTDRTEEAIQHYDRAGDLLLDAGDKAGAREMIEAIVKLNPANRQEYEALLKSL